MRLVGYLQRNTWTSVAREGVQSTFAVWQKGHTSSRCTVPHKLSQLLYQTMCMCVCVYIYIYIYIIVLSSSYSEIYIFESVTFVLWSLYICRLCLLYQPSRGYSCCLMLTMSRHLNRISLIYLTLTPYCKYALHLILTSWGLL